MAMDFDEITAKFLWEFSNTFGKSTQPMTQEIINIRLHLRDICVGRLEEGGGWRERPSERARRGLCPRCLAEWGAAARVEPLSKRGKGARAAARLLRPPLGKCRSNLSRLLARRVDQFMVFSCHICGCVTRVGVQKPEKVVKEPETPLMGQSFSEISKTSEANKKKKKKKRECFAGLNASYVVTSKRKRDNIGGVPVERKEICSLPKIEESPKVNAESVANKETATFSLLSDSAVPKDGNSPEVIKTSMKPDDHDSSVVPKRKDSMLVTTPVSMADKTAVAPTQNMKRLSGNKKKRKKPKPAKRGLDQPVEKKKGLLSAFLDSL